MSVHTNPTLADLTEELPKKRADSTDDYIFADDEFVFYIKTESSFSINLDALR